MGFITAQIRPKNLTVEMERERIVGLLAEEEKFSGPRHKLELQSSNATIKLDLFSIDLSLILAGRITCSCSAVDGADSPPVSFGK